MSPEAAVRRIEAVDRLKRLVYEKSDLHFPAGKTAFFEAKLREKMSSKGFSSFEEYGRLLEDDPLELEALAGWLTTNETYFFRNPAQFAALRDNVFPELIERKNLEVVRSWGGQGGTCISNGRHPAMNLRVWSSGCSSGEEAYSIAFTLMDALRFPRAWDVEIIATDIKADYLAKARRGVYGTDSLRKMDTGCIERFMERAGDGWSVKESIKGVLKFYGANLKELSSGTPRRLTLTPEDGAGSALYVNGYFDVIFCRNVMIYFDREGQQRLVSALYDCLSPGGYLFTGDSEPLHLFSHGFTGSGAKGALYYKKPLKG